MSTANNTKTRGPLLVTGASGQLGRRVVELLLEQGESRPILATTRTPEKLADLAARGVVVRAADFDDEKSLAAAFDGAERLLLVSTDAVGQGERRVNQHQSAIRAASAAGVRHVVYTSLTRPGPGSLVAIAPDHHASEVALEASGLGYTILRNNLYTDLLLLTLPGAVASGKLVNANGTGAVGYVTREDAARAAAAALAGPFEGRATYEVTGPATVTQAEIARLVSELTGRAIEHAPVDVETARKGLESHGMPPAFAHVYVSFDAAIAAGQLDVKSSAVRELTGAEPASVADFLARHRESLLRAS